jgi:hypothetical protein
MLSRFKSAANNQTLKDIVGNGGYKQVEWNALNFTNGVYFYR